MTIHRSPFVAEGWEATMLIINSDNLDKLPTSIGAKIQVNGLHPNLMTELHRRGFWIEEETQCSAILRRDFADGVLSQRQH